MMQHCEPSIQVLVVTCSTAVGRGVYIHGTMAIQPDNSNVVSRLCGYVRNAQESVDGESERSSVTGSKVVHSKHNKSFPKSV
jgi:hypothetical protein